MADKRFLRKVWEVTTSRNTAVTLLSIMVFVLMAGALLPNPDIISATEALKLRQAHPWLYSLGKNFNSIEISKQPLFAFLSIFLVISTTACSIERIFLRRSASKEGRLPSFAANPDEDDSFRISRGMNMEEAAALIERWLAEKRWKVSRRVESDRAVISAEKGRSGFWGSVIFHAILITSLLGWLVYSVWGLSASVVLTEGQRINLSKEELKKIEKLPMTSLALPDISFELLRFYSVYINNQPVEHDASFRISDNRSKKTWDQDIKVNKPFKYGGIDFIINLYGFSPYFVLEKDGKPVYESYVTLDMVDMKEDSFEIPEERIKISSTIYPDFFREDGKIGTKTPLPRNPVLRLDLSEEGRRLFSGLLPFGEEIEAGPYKLKFADIKYWVSMRVVREIGIGFFFIAVLIGSTGLLMRFLSPSKNYFVFLDYAAEPGVVSTHMMSSQFQGLADEEKRVLFSELKERLGDK